MYCTFFFFLVLPSEDESSSCRNYMNRMNENRKFNYNLVILNRIRPKIIHFFKILCARKNYFFIKCILK